MDCVRLVYPTKEYEERANKFIKEFYEYNSEINGTGGLHRYKNYDEWLLKIKKDLDIANIPTGRVPASTYFYIRNTDEKIIGMINIRHKLNEFTLQEGGHIGYSIRPTERKKGYATTLLKAGLIKCKELNIQNVLITCDKINVASAKVIMNNGGKLENEFFSDTYNQIVQRYWINL
ncbi:GNAT family N-acetyltransferase [Alkalicella caledoniensis]|uniref:GNAT family N-acetyltransferase n=1 Tax=Alkalicella caledoniensis TaxID=2731377 RepID=A0A7G9W647_ALKCA|nr:GNAT family N-acetyltransferase [Alkalicella caledoniensis]QNO14159.1 GNAT family N-acetyltransferase [Alkalicella caledoniensis]